jgi:hypothetical protein
VCAAPTPPAPAAEANAAAELATAYLRTDHSAFIAAASTPAAHAPTPPTDNNAYRTSIRHDNGVYSAIAATADHQSVFVGHALHKASHEHGDLELFSESRQVGAQNELQVGVLRAATPHSLSIGALHLSGTLEGDTARVNVGTHNDDGSHGFNIGAAATAIGAEGTVEYSGWSLTFGESLSVGGGFSSGGARDIDGDGATERCFKGSLGPLTLGVCTEL